MTTTLQVEPCADLIETEFWPLLEAHREELTTHKDLMQLAPLAERYREAERSGVMFVVTARDEGELVGYSVNFIGPHLHYSNLRYVHNDVLYLARSHRRGRLGVRLLAATERAALSRGAKLVVWHAKPGTALDALLPRMGYRVQDTLYSKEL